MKVLGIETSCDECSAAVVEDGTRILSNIVATQIDVHRTFYGVVPEIASRTHTEWILPVVRESLDDANLLPSDIDGVAATSRPGLSGSLLVGLSFAKGFAASLGVPFIAVDHILAHIHAIQLERSVEYPFIGLLVSGGHTIISIVNDFDSMTVLGTTIDDACGEAFDKIAKYYNFGYPGGVAIDRLAKRGDPNSYRFPDPSLHKGKHRYDVSYSGLKTAVINQLDRFRNGDCPATPENIAASFQKAAIGMLVRRVERVAKDTGITRVVAGGGVAANSLLREELAAHEDFDVFFPSMKLCTDNGAMIAGIGYRYLQRGESSPFSETISARVKDFRRRYP
jgi:N6-L-threonylcarbamoyladenine synthase